MKKILLIVLLSGLLQGCFLAAGAVVAGGAVAGGVATDPRPMDTIREDENITSLANNMIAANNTLATKTHISAVSYNRVVLLVGQAPTEEMRQQAVDLVKRVPNVKRIFNQITVGEPTSALRRSKDATITGNVKARMFATTNLQSNNFKIVTEDGTVYILGLATVQQGNIAAVVARDSSGVERVVKLIEYVPEDKASD